MAWNKIEIISIALGLLGKGPIASIAEAGGFARIIESGFDLMFPSEISKYDWRFATKIIDLVKTVDVPLVKEWKYIYQLPSDYLSLQKLYPNTIDFQIYPDKTLYSNQHTLKLEYRFLPDYSLLPSYFVDFFVSRLAKRYAVSMALDKNYIDEMDKEAGMLLVQGLAIDAQSHPNYSPEDRPYLDIRY